MLFPWRILGVSALLFIATVVRAQEPPLLSKGQTLYLSIYSHVWHGNFDRRGQPTMALLSTLVSIRNTDMASPVRVLSARYYDTEGKLLKEYLPAARLIPPLGTTELFVERQDSAGGSGANFVIKWSAERDVNPPLVEGVHLDLYSTRPVSFITTARPIVPDK